MTGAAWALTLLGALCIAAGYIASKSARMRLAQAREDMAAVPLPCRDAIEADVASSMMLGTGCIVFALGVVAFMVASLLP